VECICWIKALRQVSPITHLLDVLIIFSSPLYGQPMQPTEECLTPQSTR
jgi:hypothetical protein